MAEEQIMDVKTSQEIFDIVAGHLLRQNAKSVVAAPSTGHGATPICVYHGPGDLRCAVGALISDEQYDEAMEGENVEGLFWEWEDNLRACGLVSVEHEQLLDDLQTIHDRHLVSDWRDKLWQLAARHGLVPMAAIEAGGEPA